METTTPLLHLYLSNIPSCRYIFRSGKVANFVGGIYTTAIAAEITELDAEIAEGHPHLSIDVNRKVIAADELDPLAVLKKKLRAEILAEQEAAQKQQRDFGSSESPTGKGLQTSATLAPISAASIVAGTPTGKHK